jgi:tRNA(adenine34) deaminase
MIAGPQTKENGMDYLADEIAALDLEAGMREALLEAELAAAAGEFPIGAVIVIDGQIVSRGRARHQEFRSQVRHAELNAILAGGERLWIDFKRAILFTTLEPCPMCLGAAVMADIPHVIFAQPDQGVMTDKMLEHSPYVRRHIRSYHGGVLAAEVAALMERYYQPALQALPR